MDVCKGDLERGEGSIMASSNHESSMKGITGLRYLRVLFFTCHTMVGQDLHSQMFWIFGGWRPFTFTEFYRNRGRRWRFLENLGTCGDVEVRCCNRYLLGWTLEQPTLPSNID